MLTPFQLAQIPEPLVSLFEDLEEFVISDISRRIAKTGLITDTAAFQAMRAQELGIGLDTINDEVAKTLKTSKEAVASIIEDSTITALSFDDEIYKKAGLSPTPLRQSPYVMNLIQAVTRQTEKEFTNITRSLGFKTVAGFQPIAKYYQNACDLAHMKILSGVADYKTAIRQAVKECADSGIRFVDYESGHINRIDVAVRRAVMSGVRKTTGELALMRADEFGVTTMEITAHQGARPSHTVWQGQIVDRSGQDSQYLTLDDIGYGTGDGFQGWNCRHDWAPFFPGISVRTWTDEQLKNIDPAPIEYNGKIYTHYEATQRQRYMETAMRKTKREIIAYDAAGDSDYFTAASVKLRRQKDEYGAFSKATGLRTQTDRAGVLGYGKSISQKAIWAEKKEVSKYATIRYNKNGTIVVTDDWKSKGKVSIPKDFKPNAILETQTIYRNGSTQIDRTVYDSDGKMKKQIHSGPHNRASQHPYGKNGEHAHDYVWSADKKQIISRETRNLSDTEREEHKDIL